MSHTFQQASAKCYRSTISIKQEEQLSQTQGHLAGVWTQSGHLNLIGKVGFLNTTESLLIVSRAGLTDTSAVQLVVTMEKLVL